MEDEPCKEHGWVGEDTSSLFGYERHRDYRSHSETWCVIRLLRRFRGLVAHTRRSLQRQAWYRQKVTREMSWLYFVMQQFWPDLPPRRCSEAMYISSKLHLHETNILRLQEKQVKILDHSKHERPEWRHSPPSGSSGKWVRLSIFIEERGGMFKFHQQARVHSSRSCLLEHQACIEIQTGMCYPPITPVIPN